MELMNSSGHIVVVAFPPWLHVSNNAALAFNSGRIHLHAVLIA